MRTALPLVSVSHRSAMARQPKSKHRWVLVAWALPACFLIGVLAYFAYSTRNWEKKHFSNHANVIAEGEFQKITCQQVRDNADKVVNYVKDGHNVRVSFNYDFTGVDVTAQDGRMGRSGGPKYFCRPDYKDPRKR